MISPDQVTLDDLKEEQLEVVEIIGLESYKKLIEYFAGTSIYIPKLCEVERKQRNERIRNDYEANGDLKALAIKYSLTEVQIRSIVMDIYQAKKACPIDGQMSIYDY